MGTEATGGRPGGRRRRSLKERQVLEGEVVDLDHDGRGVVRTDGKVIFVEDCLPGERVRYQVRRRKRNYDEANLVEVLQPAPQRTVPRCPAAGVCGGCRLQHQAIEAQRQGKSRRLLQDLLRIGEIEPEVVDPALVAEPWGYRRKARLGAKHVAGKGGVLVGFREKNSPYVADLARCDVVSPFFGQLIGPLRALLSSLSIPDRIPQVEVAEGDEERAIVMRHLDPLSQADLAALEAFEDTHAVCVYLQPGGPATIHGLRPDTSGYLHYRLHGLGRHGKDISIRFRPTDFVQINGAINQLLVARAVAGLELSGVESVLDAFCGLGNFSLPIANLARQVTGVEGDAGLVAGARFNAAQNGFRNVRFEVGDLFNPLVAARLAGTGFDRLLLDPPRSGAQELVQSLPESGPQRIVYVSCNSSTLARDAGILVKQKGYRLLRAGLVDMFPHTTHGEALAVFGK